MLVQKPGDSSHLVLRATYGLLFSNDGGANWDWVCERAIGYSGNEDPTIAISGSGAVIVGTFAAMMQIDRRRMSLERRRELALRVWSISRADRARPIVCMQ